MVPLAHPQKAWLGLALLLQSFSAATPVSLAESPSTVEPSATSTPKPVIKYRAFGDSYAVGLGAGTDFAYGEGDGCYRSNGSYPNQLNLILNDAPIAEENFHACSGATTDDVAKQAEYLDETVELATITVGGNDVGFSDVVLNCVYKPFGLLSSDCDKTIDDADSKIENEFGDGLRKAFTAFTERPRHPNLQVFVTGYAHFFNAETPECKGESWNFYDVGEPNLDTGAEKLTPELRQKLNDYGLNINAKIEEIVNEFSAKPDVGTWRFVSYDNSFETHRFCEGRYDEPADKDSDHPETWFQQRLTVECIFEYEVAMLDESRSSPKYCIKILHPTFMGQTAITEAVRKAYLAGNEESA
ncbi:SGNH hydrolase-type esterase domain containing protein [Naviculisporaceae sp. PSN 640]